MKLMGQVLVVIGGTSGIGLATAQAALTIGARVVIAGRNSDTLAEALANLGMGARGEVVDAADRDVLDVFFARIGHFDHLVIAASGGIGAGAFIKLTRSDLERGMNAKFWVQWQCAQAALPYLSERASITFVTGSSARVGQPNISGLAAINGALATMVLPLAHELGPIRVNAVSPGVIDTAWWGKQDESFKERLFENVAANIPTHRVGRPEEVADAILFLAGNGYITGVILDVDGGLRGTNTG